MSFDHKIIITTLKKKVYRRGLPTVGRAGAMLQYSYVLGRLKEEERDFPTDQDIKVRTLAVTLLAVVIVGSSHSCCSCLGFLYIRWRLLWFVFYCMVGSNHNPTTLSLNHSSLGQLLEGLRQLGD